MHPPAALPLAQIRPCPNCGTAPGVPIYRQRFQAPDEGGLLAGYDVHACTVCGLGYASPLPGQSDFDEYYTRLSKYEYTNAPSPGDIARHHRTATLLRKHRGTEGRVLDMGCATGWLMQALQAEGFGNVEGIEPSPLAAARARARGLSVSAGTIWCPPPGMEPCDLLIVVAVLEHLCDLDVAMARLGRMVSAHGQIHVEVPDASRFPEAFDAPFQEFSLEHVNYFGPLSLQGLMARHGFRLVQLEQTFLEGMHTHQRLPELKALFERSPEPLPLVTRDAATADALVEYISMSAAREAGLVGRLEALAASQQPILVWGVGTLIQHLLETTALARCHIIAFLDGNPRYQGLQMAGRPILAPSAAADHPEPILIGSFQFQAEILETLRSDLGLANPVIHLYPNAFPSS